MEVLVSITVLTVGLIGMAAMVCSTLVFGTNAKYMNMANVLASEKLDNLNKWPSTDPNVASGGSLVGPNACAAADTYCDQVTVSQITGANYVTQSQMVFDPVTNTTTPVTTTIVHTSSGCVDTPANCGVPSPSNGGSTFIRRWKITPDPVIQDSAGVSSTVTGARRITVVVSLVNNISKVPVSFQMSMVRP
jgi:Tfp pilus assembly protein PilV